MKLENVDHSNREIYGKGYIIGHYTHDWTWVIVKWDNNLIPD